MAIQIKLPKSRVVSGVTTDWTQVKDDDNKPKNGKSGEPLFSNWVYLAIPKQDFITYVWPYIVQEASKIYNNAPNVHPDNYEQDGFAWKIINGDSPFPPKKKPNSQPYNVREGYAGCYIIKVTTYAFLPDTVIFQNGTYRKIDANQTKCGDFIVASVTLDTRSDKNGMGLYWNPDIYELVELGNEIKSNGVADPNERLGDANSRTHAGFQGVLPSANSPSIQPHTQTHGVAPGLPQQPQQYAQPMQAGVGVAQLPNNSFQPPVAQAVNSLPVGGYAVGGNPTTMPAPAMDFVQNAGQQPVQYAQPVQSVQAGNFAPIAGMPQLPQQPQMAQGTAMPVTSYPTNGMPALPQSR